MKRLTFIGFFWKQQIEKKKKLNEKRMKRMQKIFADFPNEVK